MSCGLKNQNNQKGGVHLTERTCSPYNPIIKLMVDDCLGLPIYPVTSVDAVIDEEGNTLRRLLDELLDKVKSGLSDVNIEITKIRNLLEQLEERVVDKEAFDALKKLVYAISSVSNISLSLDILEQNIYEIDPEHGQTTTPYIVSYIKKLKESFEDFVSFVCEVLNFNGNTDVSSYSDIELEDGKIKIINEIIKLLQAIGGEQEESLGSQIEKLKQMQENLKNLIVAIANFDTSKDIGQFSEQFGLTSSDERTRLIEIIYQITSLIEQIGGTSGGDSIIERLRILKERVDTLEEEAKTHASLDEDVLKNTPSGISESQSRKYKVLSRILYPPTSAYFVKKDSNLKLKSLNYLGFLNCVELPDNRTVDVYPIGHTDITKGYPLFKRMGTQGNYTYERVKNSDNVQLRAGKGAFSPDDYLTIIKLIIKSKEPALDYAGRDILDSNDQNISYEDLCIEYLGNKYLVGDINLDGETTITDANNVIHELVRGTQIDNPTLPILSTESSQISASPIQSTPTDLVKAWLIFEDGSSSVLYPCIDGKLYTDLYTNSTYRFKLEGTSGKMVKVSDIRFIGNDEISVEPEDVTITDLDNNNEVTDAYTQINIKGLTGVKVNSSINGLSISYPTIIKPNRDAADPGEYYIKTDLLKIYAKPSATLPSDISILYKINDVISAIDKLLCPNGVPEANSEETKKLIDRILLNKCNVYVNELLDLILDLRKQIKSLTLSEGQHGTTVYYQSDNGVSLLVVTGQKEELAKISTCDINGDGVFDIKDISDLIDILLSAPNTAIKTNLTDVGASLYRKAKTGPDEQIILSASNKDDFLGKIFKVDYGEIKPSEGNNGNNTENNSEEDNTENTNIGGSNSSEGDEEPTPFRYDEYYFDSNGEFLSVIPLFNMSINYDAATKKITAVLKANGKTISVLETSLNAEVKNMAHEAIESVAAPVFLGELVDEPSSDYPTNLHQGNNLSDKFNPMLISAPLGTFDLELFLADYLLFEDETESNTQNVSPVAVNSHEARKKFIDILNETPFISREELIETYKVAKYFKCFDMPNEEIKHILLVVSFDIIDPMLPITEENIETVTEIEIVDSTPIEENVNYYIENYGLTLRFVYEDDVLIPIVVSLEQRKAPASRVTDSVDETVVDIRPNEFLEIPEISSTDLYFDVTNVVNTFGHELLRICGTFVGVQDLNIHFITGTNHSISVPQSSSMTVNETNHSILTPENLPPIVDGTLYTYEIFNNTFRYWESSSR